MGNIVIVQIILSVFAIAYYLFSSFFTASLLQDGKETWKSIIWKLLVIALLSPIVTPIILGIKIGDAIKDE